MSAFPLKLFSKSIKVNRIKCFESGSLLDHEKET